MYHAFRYIIHNGIGIAIIRKAASVSMENTKGEPGAPKKPKIPVVAFIRDPIERLQSGWQFFTNGDKDYSKWNWARGRTYEDHVDLVLGGLKDEHWDSQAEILAGIDDLTCYKFEDLETKWEELGFPSLPHYNISNQNIEHLNYRDVELKEFYKEDIEWRR